MIIKDCLHNKGQKRSLLYEGQLFCHLGDGGMGHLAYLTGLFLIKLLGKEASQVKVLTMCFLGTASEV